MIDEAKRGFIYEWDKSDRPVLVISNDNRSRDKLIGILVFGSTPVGEDVVEINNELLGENKYLHCWLPTYVARKSLTKEIGRVSDKKMAVISNHLSTALGLSYSELLSERDFYKDKYNDIMAAMTYDMLMRSEVN